jgi:hypothetical protein
MIKFTETDVGCFLKIHNAKGDVLFIHHFNGVEKSKLEEMVKVIQSLGRKHKFGCPANFGSECTCHL